MSEENITYQEIKERETKITENYTDRNLRIYTKFHLIFRKIFTEGVLWVFSWLIFGLIWGVFVWSGLLDLDLITIFMFVISHMAYWFFAGRKSTKELLDDISPELDMILDALVEIKEERLKK